jgi:small ligand-binding sensory domain FIST
VSDAPFAAAHAHGDGWEALVERCVEGLGALPGQRAPDAELGFLYATDALSAELESILERLRARIGVTHWIGAVGIGICATGTEYYEEPALAVMVGRFPPGSFRIVSGVEDEGLAGFDAGHGAWIREREPFLGLVHGATVHPGTEELLQALASRLPTGFLAGGIASAQGEPRLVADGVTQGGFSGALFSAEVPLATRLSQGCSPIGPRHSITEARRNILARVDGRNALEVFKEDIGEVLARDLSRVGGYIFAALPMADSDQADYRVRNLVGIDPENGLVAIGDLVEPGGEVMFCRRDGESAREDLVRMLRSFRLERPPRGGVYVSCLGRGVSLFGPGSAELGILREELGEFPLVGFYANGEIFRDRLYGYTGVLTLFL